MGQSGSIVKAPGDVLKDFMQIHFEIATVYVTSSLSQSKIRAEPVVAVQSKIYIRIV